MKADYIIVGAGSAGCVLANRLSADPNVSVILIEAGPKDRNIWIHIPVGYFKTMGNPAVDWRYRTEPDPGLNGRTIPWPRGRVLGGSSSINGLLYVRGQAEDFNGWRQLGAEGWSWDDVLPFFERAETWEGAPGPLRGGEGPLSVSPNRVERAEISAWLAAAEAAGYARNPDYNGPDQEGVGYFQLTSRNGRRCSSAVAYLNPAKSRPNLTILTGAQVAGVEIAERRATGVRLLSGGPSVVEAAREVILTAGAIGSPQILMLSGVGAPDELAEIGVAVKAASPGVGKNLQDHLQARPVFKCRASTVNTETRSLFKRMGFALEYALRRTGPMTMAASLGTGFLKTREELATPDIQFHIQPFSADSPAEGAHDFDAFTASVLQLRPESVGHLTLRSPDPTAHPAIHPNYLATQTDCDTIVAGVKIARKIARQAPLAGIVTAEHAPGPDIGEDDDDAILNWVRDTAVTIYHPTGTCKMGVDDMAVVDPRLRVRGIDGLRVADASIMPVITSGNTNAPSIMIGEKASDLILEDARSAA